MQAVGGEKALAALEQATVQAFATAGLPRVPVVAACLGLAGAARPPDQAFIGAWAQRFALAAKVEVTNDGRLLLAAGTPEGWGLAVISGTGSMAIARDLHGRTARAGGWGYLLGDEGSGYAMALAGLQVLARAADGCGPPTALQQSMLKALQLQEPQDLIAVVYGGGLERAALAGLAPLVLAAADEGDSQASEIVQEQAEMLAACAVAAAARLGLDKAAVPLALAGGVFAAAPGYRDRFVQICKARGLQVTPVSLVREPAEGAIRMACAFRK
jgi:N-acetylglucosamine kinase-like BadF-type ATPase